MRFVSHRAVPAVHRERLLDLLRDNFGLERVRHADIHILGLEGNTAIAYCGLQSRVLGLPTAASFHLLGLVVVSSEFRRKGVGLRLLRYAIRLSKKDPVTGIVLNCGEDLVGFYARAGFTRISDCAVYFRDGVPVTDNDPVMALSFLPERPLGWLEEGVVIGQDF